MFLSQAWVLSFRGILEIFSLFLFLGKYNYSATLGRISSKRFHPAHRDPLHSFQWLCSVPLNHFLSTECFCGFPVKYGAGHWFLFNMLYSFKQASKYSFYFLEVGKYVNFIIAFSTVIEIILFFFHLFNKFYYINRIKSWNFLEILWS